MHVMQYSTHLMKPVIEHEPLETLLFLPFPVPPCPLLSPLSGVPVPFTQLQQVKAVLHPLHFSLMHPRYKHPRVTFPDLQVLILRPQQVLQCTQMF